MHTRWAGYYQTDSLFIACKEERSFVTHHLVDIHLPCFNRFVLGRIV